MTLRGPHTSRNAMAMLVGVVWPIVVCAGCFFSPSCPPGSPANDPDNWPVAERTDLPGVWRISYTGNLAIDGVFGWRYGPGDHFLHFDDSGDPKYEGIMAPGGEIAMWRWDLQTGAGSPSQQADGVPNRQNPDVTLLRDSEGTLTVEISYREPFQRRTDLADTDVVVRYEQLRLSPDRNTLTGLRRETRSYVTPLIPFPDTEQVAWRVSLRRVEASVVAEQAVMRPLTDVGPNDSATSPYPAGQVFDLVGSLDTKGGPSAAPSRWVWVVYRTVTDGAGAIVQREIVAEPEGQTTTFTADQAGTYTVRLWVTDGAQWSSSTTVKLVVE